MTKKMKVERVGVDELFELFALAHADPNEKFCVAKRDLKALRVRQGWLESEGFLEPEKAQ